MTERGKAALKRDERRFEVGPSALSWDGDILVVDFDEISVPRPPAQFLPKRIKGQIRFVPDAVTSEAFNIDAHGQHRWWPVAPLGRIEVTRDDGTNENWAGHGYHDCNWGLEPIEDGFKRWDWARGEYQDKDGAQQAVILYDTERKDGSTDCLALKIGQDGTISHFDQPTKTKLPRAFWGVTRSGHHDEGFVPQLTKTLEDGPFYTRSVVETQLQGEPVTLMHEGLSGDRFGTALVKMMLPFRMPRRKK